MPITVPGHRFAYDLDGSVGFKRINGGAFTTMSQAELEALNDETNSTAAALSSGGAETSTIEIGVVFPQARTIQGLYGSIATYGSYQWSYSTDTTTGQDGTWTNFTASVGNFAYFTNIQSINLTDVTGIKLYQQTYSLYGYSMAMYMMHVYGDIPSGEVADRLEIWHPTLDQQLAANDLNWGDIPRNTTADFTFRVKNMSPTQTANTITVSLDALAGSTAMETQQSLSDDGSTFGSTITIPSISANTISSVLTLRRTTPSNSPIGFSATRLIASAASWT